MSLAWAVSPLWVRVWGECGGSESVTDRQWKWWPKMVSSNEHYRDPVHPDCFSLRHARVLTIKPTMTEFRWAVSVSESCCCARWLTVKVGEDTWREQTDCPRYKLHVFSCFDKSKDMQWTVLVTQVSGGSTWLLSLLFVIMTVDECSLFIFFHLTHAQCLDLSAAAWRWCLWTAARASWSHRRGLLFRLMGLRARPPLGPTGIRTSRGSVRSAEQRFMRTQM